MKVKASWFVYSLCDFGENKRTKTQRQQLKSLRPHVACRVARDAAVQSAVGAGICLCGQRTILHKRHPT